jgi:HYR domain
MRPLFLALLFATSAQAAPVIDRIFPTRYDRAFGAERYLSIYGSAFTSSDTVVYDGGKFELIPSFISYDRIQVWVPQEIIARTGVYSVRVRTAKGVETNALEFEVVTKAGAILHLPQASVNRQATSKAGAIVEFSVRAESSADGSPLPVTCDHKSGDLFPLGVTGVHCSATDTMGEVIEGQFAVLVYDRVPPRLTLPGVHLQAVATQPDGAYVEYEVSAYDEVDGAITPRCFPASGSFFKVNVTTFVRCDAVDAHYNSTYGEFDITVVEGKRRLNLPPPMTLEATGPGGAVATFTVTSEPPATVTCAPSSGSLFPIGTTTVNCSAGEDANGSFTITVVDTTPPSLSLPADITTTDPKVEYTATATDVVDGSVGVSCAPPSGSTFPNGTTTVNCSAADTHGNSAAGTFKVTVDTPESDKAPPTVTSVGVSPEVLSPPNHKLVPVTVSITAVDDTDPDPASRVVSVSANEPMNSADWRLTGALTLELRATRSGSGPERIYSIAVETSDTAGNVTVSVVTVRVPHDAKDSSPTGQPTPSKRRSARP